MLFKKYHLIVLTFILGLLLAACGAAPAQSWSGLTSANETVYIANDTHLYAIGTDGQTLRWQQPSGGNGGFLGIFGGGSSESSTSVSLAPVYADPVVAGDLLIVSSYNKSVYGLSLTDGTQKWVFAQSTDRLIAPPVVQSDIVYVASADNTLYALNLADGTLQWSFKTNASLWAAPLVTDEVVYLPSMDHNLYALNVSDGSPKWSAPATLNGALAGSPALSEDGQTLFIGTLNDTFYALNTADGSVLWQVETKGWVWSSPVVHDGTVYFADLAGAVFAREAATGAEQWSNQVDSAVRGIPLVADDVLIIAAEKGTVYALNLADGTTKWEHVIDANNADRLLSNPLIVDDTVWIVPLHAEKLVYALSLANGNEVRAYKP